MANELLLTLDDAVMVIVDRMKLVDEEMREIVRIELEQRCYFPDEQFYIGFETAKEKAIQSIKDIEP